MAPMPSRTTVRSIVQFAPSASVPPAGPNPASEPPASDESSDQPPNDDFENSFHPLAIHSVHTVGVDNDCPVSTETISLPPLPADDPICVRRLVATYDAGSDNVYAHADNDSMACTVNDAKLLFAYRPLAAASNVRLFDAGDHTHRPLGVGFLCIPTDDHAIGGAPKFIFIRAYHTPTIPGVIISHSAISKQLCTSSYHMSSHVDAPGFIHFPHQLHRSQDVYVSLQPTSQRGGLTFTKALTLPTDKQHKSPPPPWPTRVHRLCSDHSPSPSVSVVDPTNGMSCQECHAPSDTSDDTPCQSSHADLPTTIPDFW